MDMINKINSLLGSADNFYSMVNRLSSDYKLSKIADYVCPDHDGAFDADKLSDLLLLRNRLNAISSACDALCANIDLFDDIIND